LTSDADVWSQSAWDHVPLPNDHSDIISAALERQRVSPVPSDKRDCYNAAPGRFWNQFYSSNKDNFFRDRKWLHLEFPDLVKAAEPDAGPATAIEIGCGAGNSVFPLLMANKNPSLRVIACDYAPQAINVVKANPLYTSPPVGTVSASVWDLTSPDSLPEGVGEGQVDIVILIFVLSALSPKEWHAALHNLHRMLKPGGTVLLRDYGRHDLTQLRFREGRLLDENFYIRGDGTRVYFFEMDELAILFTGSSAPKQVSQSSELSIDRKEAEPGAHTQKDVESADATDPSLCLAIAQDAEECDPEKLGSDLLEAERTRAKSDRMALRPCKECKDPLPFHPLFSIKQLGVDRRLLVNRKRQLKMYRVWMQGQFVKIDK